MGGGRGRGQQVVPVLLPAAAPLRRCTASLALYRPEDYTATAPATARPHRHNITRKVCISGGRTGTGHGSNNSRWRAGTQRRYCLGTRGLVSGVLRAWTRRCVSTYRIQPSELCRAQCCCGAHIALVTVAGAGAVDSGACWRFAGPHCGLRLAAASRLAAWPGPRPEPQAAPAPGWEDVGPVVHPAVSSPGTAGYSCTDCTA